MPLIFNGNSPTSIIFNGQTVSKVIFNGVEVYSSAPPMPTYLTFQSPSAFTLNVYDTTKHWDGTLYYSTDTTNWTIWNGASISSVNNKLYLRGTGNTIIAGTITDYVNRWVLTGSSIECIGNIENLLDWETVALGNHPIMAKQCYQQMFRNCTALKTAPSLPATTLSEECYANMFYGCTSLTAVPSLPATTLVSLCYYCMFYGCTAFKVSATQTGSYQYAWRLPTSGTGITANGWSNFMLNGTGGTITSGVTVNTTYYVENQPV
jgi:hypothetical protein